MAPVSVLRPSFQENTTHRTVMPSCFRAHVPFCPFALACEAHSRKRGSEVEIGQGEIFTWTMAFSGLISMVFLEVM